LRTQRAKKSKGYQTQEVYDALKKKIVTLDFEPGEVIDVKRLEKDLGSGRTPIREAILRLKADNLVESQPNKPIRVKEFTLTMVRDLFEAYIPIKRHIAALAARKITPENLALVRRAGDDHAKAIREGGIWRIHSCNRDFHQLIARATDNQFLVFIHEQYSNQIERLEFLVFSHEVGNNEPLQSFYRQTVEEHARMVACLEKHDNRGMGELSDEHFRVFQERLLAYMQA
jgi:DNA-binding GntR family transcriptional regulator